MQNIDKGTLEEWIETRASESETLEFKAILPDRDGKQEFLKDVSAMSNAKGGTIVYGVSEKAGQAENILAIKTENSDHAIRRLEQCMESGIEPRLTGVKFREIAVEGGYVLTVNVSRSFIGPHRVISDSRTSFFLRSHRHVAEYSYTQLREAFTLRAHAEDKIRAWRAERLLMIKVGRTPVSLQKESRYVLHVLPLVSFSENSMIDPGTVDGKNRALFLGSAHSYQHNYNLDGLVIASGIDRNNYLKYAQLFRNGALEVTGFAGSSHNDGKFIPSVRLIHLRKDLIGQLIALQAIGIMGPVGIALSLLTVEGYRIGQQEFECTPASDRDDLELPDVWVESIEELSKNVDIVVRPLFDMLFQCFNEKRCELYSDAGNWMPSG